METAENELWKIIHLRFATAFEKRTEELKGEIQAAEDEFSLHGALQSGAFVKQLIALRSKAARDVVLTTFEAAREKRGEHRLPWDEQSLGATTKAFDELIETLFSGQKSALDEELSKKYKPGGSPQAWALKAMDDSKLKLWAEIRREIDVLRSETKIKAMAPEPSGDVPELAALRQQLLEDQRRVLNTIWKYYREHQEWVPTRILHHEMGKGSVLSAIEPLGGTVVFRNQVGARDYYEMTLLGVLLSDYGSEAEKLLVSYLEYIRAQFHKNPLVEKVTAEEVQQSLQFTEEQVELLGRLILLGQFYGNSASAGKKWECGVPSDIDDLPALDNLREYVQKRAVRDYDPKEPVQPNDRLRYSLSKKPKPSETEFDFIQDRLLRDQLAKDWDETQRVREVKAWKSCVILCGGVLEGMLLDVLKGTESLARSTYQKRKGKEGRDRDQWDLVDLVNIAKDLGLLSKSAEYLSHGLREFRNLIHPGKQIRENVSLTQEEAEIAFNVVKVCLRELSSRLLHTQ